MDEKYVIRIKGKGKSYLSDNTDNDYDYYGAISSNPFNPGSNVYCTDHIAYAEKFSDMEDAKLWYKENRKSLLDYLDKLSYYCDTTTISIMKITYEEVKLLEKNNYLDMVVEKAFREGMLYQESCMTLNDDVISKEQAIENAKENILGE